MIWTKDCAVRSIRLKFDVEVIQAGLDAWAERCVTIPGQPELSGEYVFDEMISRRSRHY